MPASLMVKVLQVKYLNAKSSPSLSNWKWVSSGSFTAAHISSVMLRFPAIRRSLSDSLHMYLKISKHWIVNICKSYWSRYICESGWENYLMWGIKPKQDFDANFRFFHRDAEYLDLRYLKHQKETVLAWILQHSKCLWMCFSQYIL